MPPDSDAQVDNSTRRLWLQRCRIGASVPRYVVENFTLDELFEFAPDPDRRNGDFLIALAPREMPDGAPKAHT